MHLDAVVAAGQGKLSTFNLALQLATVAILALTLWLTSRLAAATRLGADVGQQQLAIELVSGTRPLLSVRAIELFWNENRLSIINFRVSNSGQGACFNVVVTVTAYGSQWPLSWSSDAGIDAFGAMASGDERSYVAGPLTTGIDLLRRFENELEVTIECFDTLLRHYQFAHRFLLSPGTPQALEAGLVVRLAVAESE